ncbi:hypothetical protein [Inquilinus sp. OTU3971]|uniref:hypothetical protein n=1 Tax=Inquilinus sp. OTU3971 TaxID=3043855 RepID=UPI00313DFBB6
MDLEDTLKAYFWRAGYFVVRGVPFRVDGDDVTDIDLWLYERPGASTRRRLIVDVKNRKSPRASERLIWTKGLQSALGVDGAIVATTDKRIGSRRLARALNVMLLDGDGIGELIRDEQLKASNQLSSTEFDEAVKAVDEQRRSSEWRQALYEARTALLSGMGVHSTNRCLAANLFFAEQAVLSQPGSVQSNIAVRLCFFTAALVTISLDYMLAEQIFRPIEERRESVTNSIRFGQTDAGGTIPTIRGALGLVRKYAENGSAVAKQVEYGFYSEAERIPAEIIAEYVTRGAVSDGLFDVARQLAEASYAVELPSFDQLLLGAKSILGVFLDFNGVSREKLALAWPQNVRAQPYAAPAPAAEAGPLFRERGRSAVSPSTESKKSR